MIEVPLGAKVRCTDGVGGESTQVIVNPIDQQITHLVVQDKQLKPTEHLVPVVQIESSSSDEIRLKCTIAELEAMEPLVETEYIRNDHPDYDNYLLMPYAVMPASVPYTPVESENVPAGQLAVRRGTLLEATDGYVGKVDELLIDQVKGNITHVISHQGHLWRKREIAIPLSAIDRVEEETVYLNLDKQAVDALPGIPITRYYDMPQQQVDPIELLIVKFDDTATADKALEAIKELSKDKSVQLINVAVLTKDADGETSIKEIDDVYPRQGAWVGGITGGLIGLLAGPIGAVVGAAAGAATGRIAAGAIDLGFKNQDLQTMIGRLEAGGSAIVILVKFELAERVLDTLAPLNGELVRETLTEEMIAKLADAGDE